jgi:hypothetical protein
MTAEYVVYGHYNDSGECFYVGAGSNERPYMLCKSQRSTGWYEYLKQNCASGKPEVKIWHSGLTWEQAQEYERFWISIYGRRDLETGCLVNLTDGGDGTFNPSKNTRELISKTHKNIKKSEAHNAKMTQLKIGRVFSDETKNKLAEAARGKPQSEESRKKNSEAKRGTKGKGYHFRKDTQKWQAEIWIMGKKYGLGCHIEEGLAEKAYKTALENYKNKGELPCR